MKKYICSILFLTFAFINFSYGQGQTHVITLEVQTQQIAKPDLEPFCSFGQDQSISNEDFLIEVEPGDIIRWNAVSADAPGTDVVQITGINHASGANFFGAPGLNNNGQGNFVMGFINSGNPGEIQKYDIRFKVFNNGVQRNGTFIIDPKIKIKN
ncbi:MAG: hypothetical protein HKN67_00010 [Saprospiraceae bacterium]|nr:hypothetical protein [Saprospiraceae bacterium]